MIPGVKTVRRGTRAYLPKKKIQELIEKGLRPMIEKEYPIHVEKNEVTEVAGFAVGLRELNINLKLSLESYAINFLDAEHHGGKLIFILESQQVKGQVKIHVDKKMEIVVNMGDIINKDYVIDFSFILQRLVVEAEFRAENGLPRAQLKVMIEDLELERDLKFIIENSDLITGAITLFKPVWMPLVEHELKNKVLPKLDDEVTKAVKELIEKHYKPVVDIEGPLNLQIDVTVHEILVRRDFLILTIDGHFNNSKNGRDMDQVANPTFDMPKILDTLSGEDIALQISDDNLYTLIYAILQNKVDIEVDIDKLLCNNIVLYREPNYSAVIAILRKKEDNTEGSAAQNLGIRIAFEIFAKVTVDLKPLPDFDVRLKVKSELCDLEILDEKRTAEEFFVKLAIADTEVLSLYDEEMHAIAKLSKNNTVYNKIRDKMAKEKITQEIKVKTIKVGEKGRFAPTRMEVSDNFLVVVGHLTF